MTVKPGLARKRDRMRRHEANGAPWALSATEWRLLTITFIGGLGSIITGACVIGAAISIDRAIAAYQHPFRVGSLVLATPVVLLLATFNLWLAWGSDDLGKVRWFVFVTSGLLIALTFLVWIGLAAGVH